MKVIVLTQGEAQGLFPGIDTVVFRAVAELKSRSDADLCVDLDFETFWMQEKDRGERGNGKVAARLASLAKLTSPVILNAVIPTITQIGWPFIRMNGWPGFAGREVHELAFPDAAAAERIGHLYKGLGRAFRPAPDVPGMITARILAAIINEAWYTWEQGVSSKEEIDTAMKLGMNYPMGPFGWGTEIGLEKILSLLEALGAENDRYTPAKSLKNAVGKIKI